MRRRCLSTALAAGLVVSVAGSLATAEAVSKPKKVAKLDVVQVPSTLVDSKGTALLAFTQTAGKPDQYGERYPYVRVARKTKKSKKYSIVKPPQKQSTVDPFLYQPSKGELELIATVNGPETLVAWKSTNDGKTWKSIDASYVNQSVFRDNGIYLASSQLHDVNGTAVQYAGSDGAQGSVVRISADLKHVTQIATDTQGATQESLGATPHGTLFQVGLDASVDPSSYPFEVDGSGVDTGTVTFPGCDGAMTNFALAVGKSTGVVIHSSCGHVWTRTISTAGKVGPVKKIGKGSKTDPSVQLVADTHHHFTATYANPSGDESIARSTNGKKWKAAKGALPTITPTAYGTIDGAISRGTATLFGYGIHGKDPNSSQLDVVPLSDTYKAPKSPSAKGIPHPKRKHLGSLAVTAPSKIKAKKFRPHGKSTVRLVDVVGGATTVSVEVERPQGGGVLELCSGSAQVKLKPKHVKTLHLTCSNGAVVIGGTASPRVPVKKGDSVTYSFSARNGTVTVPAKIS